jgi:hypothetical protein
MNGSAVRFYIPHRHSQPSIRARIATLRQQLQHRHQAMTQTSHDLKLAIRGQLTHPLMLCSAAGIGFVLGHQRHSKPRSQQGTSTLASGMELLMLVEYLLKLPLRQKTETDYPPETR